jgi:NodT family efflux transporter outer membrane factor (OMF) lipoprotein
MNRTNPLIAMLLFAFLLVGGCTSYRNLAAPPKADVEGAVRDGGTQANDTTSIADLPWKEYFADTKLQALISEGLERNSDLKTAVLRIKEAEGNLGVSLSASAPTLSAGAGMDHTRTSSGTRGRDVLGYVTHQNTLGFTASWEIDLWGKLGSASKAKYASLLSSREYADLVKTKLVSEIAQDYYKLLALDKELDVTRKSADVLRKNVETTTALKEAGRQNSAAVDQSEATLQGTLLSVLSLETQIREQENAICVLVGRKPGTVDRSQLEALSLPSPLSTGVPVRLLSRRPDVREAELGVQAAYATTDAARASFYPSLSITSASFGLSGDFTDFFSLANLAASVSASLTQPIFDRGKLKNNLKVAEAQQEAALVSFHQTVLEAGQEVSNILYGCKQSWRKDELRERQIAALERAAEATMALLVAGEVDYLDVLSAQTSLLSAELSGINDRLEKLDYAVDLYRALGGGLR